MTEMTYTGMGGKNTTSASTTTPHESAISCVAGIFTTIMEYHFNHPMMEIISNQAEMQVGYEYLS